MSNKIDDKQLAEIEARARAATEGPWNWTYHPRTSNFPNDVMALESSSVNTDVLLCTGDSDISWGEISAPDAAFVAHAREDVPALCATVRHLLEENARLTKDLATTKQHRNDLIEELEGGKP